MSNVSNQGALEGATIIDSDVEFIGKLKIKSNKRVVIRGIIEGEVESDGAISVDAGGVVRGSINTRQLIVAGRIETDQDVNVVGRLTMKKGGFLSAKRIIYGDMTHESGARISGQLEPCETPYEEVEAEIDIPDFTKFPVIGRTGVGASALAPRSALGKSLASVMNAHNAAPVPAIAPTPIEGVESLPFNSESMGSDRAGQNAEQDKPAEFADA